MSNYLQSVTVKNRKYDLNFKDCFAVNLINDGNCVRDGYGLTEITSVLSSSGAVAFYRVDGKYFLCYSDGKVYQLSSIFRAFRGSAGIKTPVVCGVQKGNTVKYIFVGESSFDLNGEEIDLPASTVATVFNGRLFTAKNRVITFSKPFDFENNAVSMETCGSLGVCESAGNVVGFFSDGDKLAIICERAIYSLTAIGESIDFKFERLNIPVQNAKANTVKCFNDGCVFVDGNKLVKYSGGKLTEQKVTLKSLDFTIYGKAAKTDEIYILPVNVGGQDYLYVYSLIDGSESFIKGTYLVADGGYAYAGGEKVLQITSEVFTGERVLKSNAMDFNDCEIKTVSEVSAFVGDKCTLTVNGEFGGKKFTLKSGANKIKTNLKSKIFALEFSSTNPLLIKRASVKYRLKGE